MYHDNMPRPAPEQQVRDFQGLTGAIDDWDIGASAATILTNLQVSKTGTMESRSGWLEVSFEEDS